MFRHYFDLIRLPKTTQFCSGDPRWGSLHSSFASCFHGWLPSCPVQSDLVRTREQAIRKTCCSHLVVPPQALWSRLCCSSLSHLLLLPRLFLYRSSLPSRPYCFASATLLVSRAGISWGLDSEPPCATLTPLLASVQNKARYALRPRTRGLAPKRRKDRKATCEVDGAYTPC